MDQVTPTLGDLWNASEHQGAPLTVKGELEGGSGGVAFFAFAFSGKADPSKGAALFDAMEAAMKSVLVGGSDAWGVGMQMGAALDSLLQVVNGLTDRDGVEFDELMMAANDANDARIDFENALVAAHPGAVYSVKSRG